MSVQQARKFYDKVVADSKLQAQVDDLRKSHPKGGPDVISKIMGLATQHGFNFSAEDAKKMLAEVAKGAIGDDAELNESQLQAVAGGKDEDTCACQWPYGSDLYITST